MIKKLTQLFETGTKTKLFALFLFLGFIAYANSFDNTFHLDDHTSLRNVRSVRGYNNLALLVKDRTENIAAYLTFALNHHLSGQKVYSYHAVNFMIHVTAAWFVFLLIRLLLAEKQKLPLKEAQWCAVWAALLFLLHPLQTQAVTYIVQRIASLAALFYLLSVYSYIKARITGKNLFYAAALAAAFAAFFTKQNTYSLPVIFVVYEILWRGNEEPFCFKKVLLRLVPFAGILAFVYFALYHTQVVHEGLSTAMSERGGLDRASYFLTQLSVVPYYLKLMVVPWGQALEYDWVWAKSLFELRTLLGASFLVLFFGFGLFLSRRGQKTAAFGIFWFFITLSIESSFIPLPDAVFEHRMYLPMAGLCALFAFVVLKLKERPWVTVVIAAILLMLMGLTIQRNRVWDNPISLYEDNLQKYPKQVRLLLNLSEAYERQNNQEKALRLLEEAYTIIDAKEPNWENNSFRVRALTGLAKIARAEKDYDTALKYMLEVKEYVGVGFDTIPLCVLYHNKGDLAAAQQCAEEHLEKMPDYYWPNFIVGKTALEQGDLARAEKHLAAAFESILEEREETGYLRSQSDLAYSIMFELGVAMMNANKLDRAIIFFEQASHEDALRAEAYYLKALCYFGTNQIPDALNQIKILEKLGRKDLLDLLRKRISVNRNVKTDEDDEIREKYKLIVAQIDQAKQAAQALKETKAIWNTAYQSQQLQSWMPMTKTEVEKRGSSSK